MATILQFGGGVFLRGFVEVFVDEANEHLPPEKQHRVAIVERNRSESSRILAEQHYRYGVLTQGILAGKVVREHRTITCVERIYSAADEWAEILETASMPSLQVVASNTTESGIVYDDTDTLGSRTHAPRSFPCKLLACLYARWKAGGDGLLLLPTELIEQNGAVLKSMLLRHIERLGLENAFRSWFAEHNVVCTTLADRIVPGTLSVDEQHTLAQETGLYDRAALAAEPYRFWAIEAPQVSLDHVRERLAWLNNDHIVIEPDITLYRERKLRLLNGGHSVSAMVGLLLGCSTVRELMEHPTGKVFVERVLREEIAPTLPYDAASMLAFTNEVLDRFRNPFLHHSLRAIATHSTTKFAVRVLPTIVRFYQQFGKLPELLVLGFASYAAIMLRAPSSKVAVTWSDDTASTLPQAPEQGYAVSGSKAAFSRAVQTLLQNPVWSALYNLAAPQAALLSDALRQRCEQMYATTDIEFERFLCKNG